MENQNQMDLVKKIKTYVVVAIFADPYFYDLLVLKGGNAIDLIYKRSARSSVDVDLSMEGAFDDEEELGKKLLNALNRIFNQEGFTVFDMNLKKQPATLSEDVATFWGGYCVKFKIIESEKYDQLSQSLNKLRRNAIMVGQKGTFKIDISNYEYTTHKKESDLDGYTVYVYSEEMIVFEKLRALCQQMPEYKEIVHRGRDGAPRAKDFVDICTVIETSGLDIVHNNNKEIFLKIFEAKKVDVALLGKVDTTREFHKQDFQSVKDTVYPEEDIKDFDYYFEYVADLVKKLKTAWDI